MADKEKDKPAKEAKKLTQELLKKQIAASQQAIDYAQKSIAAFTQQLEQERGVLNYATHLLSEFELPPTEPKKEKAPLEVK